MRIDLRMRLVMFGALAFFVASYHQPALALTVTISLHKKEILLGEPLLVRLVIRNEGSNSVQLNRSPDFGWVAISNDGKSFRRFHDQMRPFGKFRPCELVQGAAVTNDITVLYASPRVTTPVGSDLGLYAFAQTGIYYLRAGYGEDGEALSETVTCKVTSPSGEDDTVWRLLRENDSYPRLIYGALAAQAEPRNQKLDLLTSTVVKFPTSVYCHYVALALGRYYLSLPDSRPTAMVWFEKAATMTQVPFLREEGLYEWARMAPNPQAIIACELGLKDFPGSRYKEAFELILARARRRSEAKPLDQVAAVEVELERQGYDLVIQDQKLLSAMIQYVFAEPEEARARGEFTDKQMLEEQARRYKEWITQNLKPTLPPKTNDTPPPSEAVPTP